MRVEIRPSRARGLVTAPPSKSMAHRLLICAGLAQGESIVRSLAYSEDVKATIACLRSLGAQITLDGDTAYVKGVDVMKPLGMTAVLPCNECGSTLRFFIPICLLSQEERVLTGSARLMMRPLDFYEALARLQKLRFEKFSNHVTVQGPMYSADFVCPGDISSQFFSGMMFALPLLNKKSYLRIREPVESRPYIDMTIAALKTFGVFIRTLNDSEENRLVIDISGGQYTPADVTVEGDYSNAAFFEALNYAGSNVMVKGLNEDSAQGDKVYKILFKKINEALNIVNFDAIDISDCPDLGPILFAVAALTGGGRFTGTHRLKIKESDRANAMKSELKKFGITVDVEENDVIVHPGELCAPTEPLSGHNDHRIVMALSVLLTATGGVIEGAEAVNKSFPDFFERLQDLGVDLTYGMDQ
ncbi:MAG: 3-phosphoshikimate 1-carboxyvinyltransferase [Ruminococcus sp.]|uniref:3-phosphoshikimate 1-carboxyvinyltransferase n=1 Tax=Ruminococcus sp. TaxID=41978 RepID=UPI002872FE44|nr:3-phosphoshikimate 1-carboxyvinyltransferase [Ruminococcus sp.]MBQ3284916.1 3-phosphoshikimate 1-carboxyvinyltransferase [Ruminococcus sp.]